MSTLNKVMLIGHLGDEIKLHHFDGGGSLGRVPMATNERWKNQQGEEQSRVDWHNLVFRNKTAEVIEKYTSKGDKLYIEGKLRTRTWEQDGQKRWTTEVNVERFMFLNSKKQQGEQHAGHDFTNMPADIKPNEPDDLPF